MTMGVAKEKAGLVLTVSVTSVMKSFNRNFQQDCLHNTLVKSLTSGDGCRDWDFPPK
jgi:hypothetical protein